MPILLAVTAGLVVWVISWALDIKGFDGLMLAMLIALIGCAYYVVRPFLPGNREDPTEPRSGASWTPR